MVRRSSYAEHVRHDEYAAYDGTGLAQLIAAGEVTRDDVLRAATSRIDAVNGHVNAVVHRVDPPADAGDPIDGPLAGVPFVTKDMDGRLAGHPASHGSRALAGWVPDHDSELIHRYKAAGLRIIGKTNCPELGIMGVTEPELHGPTRNPWNLAGAFGTEEMLLRLAPQVHEARPWVGRLPELSVA